MTKTLLAALVALALLAGNAGIAGAREVADGTAVKDKTGQSIAGVAPGAIWKVIGVDANGYPLFRDVSRDYWTYFSRIYNDTLSNAGKKKDSTGVYQIAPYRRHALSIHPITAGAAGDSLIIYVQIRGHWQSGTDSTSSFPWAPWIGGGSNGPNLKDAIGHYAAVGLDGGAGTNGSPNWNEYVLIIKPDVDLATASGAGQPKDVTLWFNDFPYPYFDVRFRVGRANAGTLFCRTRLDVTYVGLP